MSHAVKRSGKPRGRLGKTLLIALSATALTVGLQGSASAGVLNPLPFSGSTFQNKYMPLFDYDSDSCFPAAAIDANGNVNGGLKTTGSITGGCRSGHLGKANTYAQSVCKNGWCAYLYTLYFEKDQTLNGSDAFGHRHDWESVAVFQKQGSEKPSYLAASRHGGYSTHPINEVPMSGNRVEIVYHKDGASTHAFRFAKWGETPEAWGNGSWDAPTLVNYSALSGTLQSRLNDTDWGHANFQLGKNFLSNINKARPSAVPAF